jgi:MFS transporter, DHA3 family, macrolide efflux protein
VAVTAGAERLEPTPERRASLWRNRTFLALLSGQAISVIGDGFHSVALGLWVLQTTGSATAMATIMSVRVLTTILLGSFAGAVVDRVDRRRLMIAMNVVRFGVVAVIALLMAGGRTGMLPIVVLTGALAVCGNFFGPAFQASLINIVRKEDIQKATGVLQVTNTLGQVVGPFLGGTLVATTSGALALTVDAVSFLAGALFIWAGGSFASPRRASAGKASIFGDMREGFGLIRRNPLILSLVSVAPPLNFFGNAFGLLLPVVAVRVWMVSPTEFGAIEAIFPLGFALGAAMVMMMAAKIRRRGWWIITGIFFAGVGATLVPLSPTVPVALPLMAFTGFAISICNVMLPVIMQHEVPAEMQGRVFGTLNSLTSIASPVAMMLAGLLADKFDPVLLAAGAGGLMVLTSLAVGLFARPLRTYN